MLGHFTLEPDTAPLVAHICRRLDGLPLAIELAAARTASLSLEDLSSHLDDCFALLTGGARTALPRQRTLEATVTWSYQMLSERQRELFNQLAVFAGGWTLAAAETVCARAGIQARNVVEDLAALVDKSLVVCDVAGRQANAIPPARDAPAVRHQQATRVGRGRNRPRRASELGG